MLTASFSEARRDLTSIADRVCREGVEFTIFKRSKPLFKIVPFVPAESDSDGRGSDAHDPLPAASAQDDRLWPSAPSGYLQEEKGASDGVPSGGQELFDYAMALRERAPQSGHLRNLTCDDMKRELGERYA